MLKKYLPLVLYTFLRKKISRPIFCKSYFKYWQKRFLAYSGFCNPEKAASKRALIIMRSHVIEKGLSMPHFRLGFGQEMLNDLIEDLRNCKPAFDRDPAIIAASHVVNEYAKVHMENKHELPDELLKKIQMVRQKFGSFASRQRIFFTYTGKFSIVRIITPFLSLFFRNGSQKCFTRCSNIGK